MGALKKLKSVQKAIDKATKAGKGKGDIPKKDWKKFFGRPAGKAIKNNFKA